MNTILKAKRHEIAELCRNYGVAKLEVFGSANTPEFDTETSDFDFILEFGEDGDHFVRFMEFTSALEQLLGRPADFVSEERLKPRFLKNIASTREVLFASSDQTIAA